MSLRLLAGHLFGLVFLLMMGCGGAPTSDSKSPEKLRVVVTTGMVADLVQHVLGQHGEVTALMGPGVDPHLFKATSHDIKQLQKANVVFYSGLMLEGRMQDALAKVHRPNRPVVPVTELLEANEKSFLRSPPQFEGHYDPHVWMDVQAWSRCLEVVVNTLSTVDAVHADEFKQNADTYRAELAELDEYVRKVIASIPESQRVLVTAHDAFGYFGRRYEIPVYSVQGVSTESEAGIKDINRLVNFLVERKLPAIFVESSVNEKNIRAVIEGAAAQQVTVRVGGELFSDAMGPDGAYEGTYIGMVDHNATSIARALGGEAPERGFRGQLRVDSVKESGSSSWPYLATLLSLILLICMAVVHYYRRWSVGLLKQNRFDGWDLPKDRCVDWVIHSRGELEF